MKLATFGVLAAILVGGCSTTGTTLWSSTRTTFWSVQVTSEPEGAYITDRGTGMASTTARVEYDSRSLSLASSKDPGGCYLVQGFDARWASGAARSVESVRLCADNTSVKITLSRDPNAPGLERDLELALKLRSLRAQQEQAAAAKRAAIAAAIERPPVRFSRPSLDCTSRQSGGTVYTSCN
jgi:hypothetical protein